MDIARSFGEKGTRFDSQRGIFCDRLVEHIIPKDGSNNLFPLVPRWGMSLLVRPRVKVGQKDLSSPLPVALVTS